MSTHSRKGVPTPCLDYRLLGIADHGVRAERRREAGLSGYGNPANHDANIAVARLRPNLPDGRPEGWKQALTTHLKSHEIIYFLGSGLARQPVRCRLQAAHPPAVAQQQFLHHAQAQQVLLAGGWHEQRRAAVEK
jgi:hypothetical protein